MLLAILSPAMAQDQPPPNLTTFGRGTLGGVARTVLVHQLYIRYRVLQLLSGAKRHLPDHGQQCRARRKQLPVAYQLASKITPIAAQHSRKLLRSINFNAAQRRVVIKH